MSSIFLSANKRTPCPKGDFYGFITYFMHNNALYYIDHRILLFYIQTHRGAGDFCFYTIL